MNLRFKVPIHHILKIRILRFLLVGAFNTLFGYLLFSLFIYFGFHYTLATLLSTILGVLFNFETTGKIVFYNKDNSLVCRFFLVYAAIYILNITFLKMFDIAQVNMYYAGAILMVPMAFISYSLNLKFVFGVKK
ncbi:MAG: GtrA family protein [Smithella sp.]